MLNQSLLMFKFPIVNSPVVLPEKQKIPSNSLETKDNLYLPKGL